MAKTQLDITAFVRGMAWHDIGKPYALGTRKHTALGYWLLKLGGYDGEALVALVHGDQAYNVKRYFNTPGAAPSLPAVLALTNALDRLAASVYSLQSRGLKTELHTAQNPFTRLPLYTDEAEQFVVPHDNLSESFEIPLWARVGERLPARWREVLTPAVKRAVENDDRLPAGIQPLPAAEDALAALRQPMTFYPERTYPSVNDTTLARHGRLSAILAFVVYRNLVRDGSVDWTEGEITPNNATLPKSKDVEAAIQDHLACSLVRIALTGLQAMFEQAVRVDDLLGALALAERTRAALKRTLAEALGAPDLAAFLPISEDPFDLIVLLPPADVPPASLVHGAYEAAIARVSGAVADELTHDLPQFAASEGRLRRQLGETGYGLRVIPIEVPKRGPFDKFDNLAAKYGKALLDAYVACQGPVPFPAAALPQAAAWAAETEALPAAETCQVCGDRPVVTPPESLSEDERSTWQRQHDHAAHIFRGERERVCLACMVRRSLAHGAVAKRMDPLVHPMLTPAADRPGLWRKAKPAAGPAPPPALASAVALTDEDAMIDAGAFYVRRRAAHGTEAEALDVFPTIGYAADANSNTVLLALQPTASLFATYAYDEALKKVGAHPADSEQDASLWHRTFTKFHNKIVEENQEDLEKYDDIDLAEPIRHVYPHLARVMERIRRIETFYEALTRALAEDPPDGLDRLRVLPLDVGFPTLRLLLPADRLDRALHVLDWAVTTALLSAPYEEDPQKRKGVHDTVLKWVTPNLLHGAVVLFKQKFPLYLALEAERDVFQQMADDEPEPQPDGPLPLGTLPWYGVRLGLCDLRGSLSEVGPLHAEVTYEGLGEVLDLVARVDRRTVQQYQSTVKATTSSALAEAQAMVRTRKVAGLRPNDVRRLIRDDRFPAVHFIKRAIRR